MWKPSDTIHILPVNVLKSNSVQQVICDQDYSRSKSALKKLRGRLTRYEPVSQEKNSAALLLLTTGLVSDLKSTFLPFHIRRSRFTCLLRLLRWFGLAFASLLQLGLTFTKIDGLLLGILKLKKEIRPISMFYCDCEDNRTCILIFFF